MTPRAIGQAKPDCSVVIAPWLLQHMRGSDAPVQAPVDRDTADLRAAGRSGRDREPPEPDTQTELPTSGVAAADLPRQTEPQALLPSHLVRPQRLRRDGGRALQFSGVLALRFQCKSRLEDQFPVPPETEGVAAPPAPDPAALHRVEVYLTDRGDLVVASRTEYSKDVAAMPVYRAQQIDDPGALVPWLTDHDAAGGLMAHGLRDAVALSQTQAILRGDFARLLDGSGLGPGRGMAAPA